MYRGIRNIYIVESNILFMEKDVENLAKILAVLVAEGNYTYVDKIGNAPSKDLLAFYLKETFRDFHSLMRSVQRKMGLKNY